MARIRLIVADDSDLVRRVVVALLKQQEDMEVVAEAVNGLEAVEHSRATSAAVAVLDLSMPVCDGFTAARTLNQCCPHVRSLAFTRERSPDAVARMLRAGALGYVLKHSPSEILCAAIRAVAAGQLYLDPNLGRSVLRGSSFDR